MANKDILIATIKKVHFTGKWVEFWFEKDIESEGSDVVHTKPYDMSSKSGYLWDAIDKADIYDDIISNGLKGKKLQWKKIGINWKIDKFFED